MMTNQKKKKGQETPRSDSFNQLQFVNGKG